MIRRQQLERGSVGGPPQMHVCGCRELLVGAVGWLLLFPGVLGGVVGGAAAQEAGGAEVAGPATGAEVVAPATADQSPLGIELPESQRRSDSSPSDSAAGMEMEDGSETAAADFEPPLVRRSEALVDLGESFVLANAAYEQGAFAQAIALYSRVVDSNPDNGYLHYNLGNAYLRNGELGQAIASYLRSRSILPRNQDVVANLRFAQTSTRDAIEPPQPSATMRTLFFWHYALSRAELVRLAVGLNLLLWAALAARLWFPTSDVLRWSGAALFVVLVAVGVSLGIRLARSNLVAVVVPQEVEVYSANSLDSVVRFKLHAGTQVRLVESRSNWIRVGLPDGVQGWIEHQHAEVVEL